MSEDVSQRFVALVKRELRARLVRFRDDDDPPEAGAIAAALPDGRFVEALFASVPEDAEAMTRRLEMLIGAFEGLAAKDAPKKRRDPPAVSLNKELRALVKRSQGSDAAVIDAQSPVVWAYATASEDDDESALARRDRAIGELRSLPQMGALHRGGHLALSLRDTSFGYVARSFAGIYVLFVTFDHAFDEIRAERALRDALPRIERLVLALPPLDPEPVPAGVVALRPRRRRLR